MAKKSNKKFIILVMILCISIGYAYLSSAFNISGLGLVKKTVWNIYFDNVKILEGNDLSSTPPIASKHSTTSLSYSVNLNKPGDVYKFNVDIVNNGTIDAMVSVISENSILDSEQSKYATYSINYLDGTPLKIKNYLGKNSKKTIQVTIKYKKDITVEELPTTAMSLDFNLDLSYVQAKYADSSTNDSTLINDISNNGNNGVMYGGRVNADGTIYLDGVDDYIECGLANYDFGTDMTYVIRLKTISLSKKDALTAIFGNWRNAGGGLYYDNNLEEGTSNYAVQFNNNNYFDYKSNELVNLNEWTTIVGKVDSGVIKLYVNGQFKEEYTGNGDITINDNLKISENPITIGGIRFIDNNYGEFANIVISDALVFDRGLTEAEIASDYATTINPTNTQDMLLRYKLTSENKIKDLSGNSNDGTIVGATVNSDGTITTDGIDDYINCGLANHNFGSNLTYAFRFKMNQLYDTESSVLFNNTESNNSGINISNKKISFGINNGTEYINFVSTKEAKLNTWYTVVGTYDGSKLKLYINGKEAERNDVTNSYEYTTTGTVSASSLPFVIGANPNGYTSPRNITVSDALVYNRALTKEEVENEYKNTISPSNRENLLLYYHFG